MEPKNKEIGELRESLVKIMEDERVKNLVQRTYFDTSAPYKNLILAEYAIECDKEKKDRLYVNEIRQDDKSYEKHLYGEDEQNYSSRRYGRHKELLFAFNKYPQNKVEFIECEDYWLYYTCQDRDTLDSQGQVCKVLSEMPVTTQELDEGKFDSNLEEIAREHQRNFEGTLANLFVEGMWNNIKRKIGWSSSHLADYPKQVEMYRVLFKVDYYNPLPGIVKSAGGPITTIDALLEFESKMNNFPKNLSELTELVEETAKSQGIKTENLMYALRYADAHLLNDADHQKLFESEFDRAYFDRRLDEVITAQIPAKKVSPKERASRISSSFHEIARILGLKK